MYDLRVGIEMGIAGFVVLWRLLMLKKTLMGRRWLCLSLIRLMLKAMNMSIRLFKVRLEMFYPFETMHAQFEHFSQTEDKLPLCVCVINNGHVRFLWRSDEICVCHCLVADKQIEKLKVEQCKLYLRKNGLRLTGNKDTLIQRIKEHLE